MARQLLHEMARQLLRDLAKQQFALLWICPAICTLQDKMHCSSSRSFSVVPLSSLPLKVLGLQQVLELMLPFVLVL